MKKKRLLPLGILVILAAAAFIYTRPMTLQEIGKVDIAQCESVSGYHLRCPEVEDTYFELSADDERFSQLVGLFARQKFRRSLRNLLPLETTSDMPQNNLIFDADFSFNDGQDYLYFQSSFGQPNLFSTTGNNLMLCTTSRQKEFLQQVYDMLSSDTP